MPSNLHAWYQKQQARTLAEKVELLQNRVLMIESLEFDDLKRADKSIEYIKQALGDAWNDLPELQNGVALAREQLSDAGMGIESEFNDFDSFKDELLSKAGAKISQQLTGTLIFLTTIIIGLRNLSTIAGSIVISFKKGDKTQKRA